ncbi:glycosyltransferase [Steroidobacter sp. S1-65]|uniref:Glycosyltransferase n=1 Tax=Steroidobacter gossypii TaxID=2805490 RepID=A0ABS1X398_9GAMM|nr:glycosyltransferase [Steroidobacter gossypii]MBM0107690.1 glycosyltransferase [Steroidobacter gossypii]
MRLDLPRSGLQQAREALVFSADDEPISHDGPPLRVLLLTSGLGLGHVRAAQAVAAALKDQAEIETVDFWSLMHSGAARAIHATYLDLVQNHSDLYERLYHLEAGTWRQVLESKSGPPREVLEVFQLIASVAAKEGMTIPRGGRYASDKLLYSLLCTSMPYDGDSLAGNGVRARLALWKFTWLRLIRRLEPAIRKFAPDVIVSTQMIPAAMASYLKQRGKVQASMIGVLTDFGVHDFWKQRGVDRYCVAHESILDGDGAATSSRAVVTGVPLMPDFAFPPSQSEARRELGLPEDAQVVLVLGGGLGISVDTAAMSLLRRPTSTHVIVMPGKNNKARAALDQLAARHPQRLRVCDWTDRMDIYLRAADIVVGKPGGITVAEALACGRPLLATRSLGGQEGFNVDFLTRHEVGGLVADGELLNRVDALLGNREALQNMQRRAWLLGQRDGAARVAQLALDLASIHRTVALQSR